MSRVWNHIEDWDKVLIIEVCDINPSKKELNGIDASLVVSFGMMDELQKRKPLFKPITSKTYSEVKKGSYSYFREDDVLLAKMTPCFENGKSGIATNLENGIGFGSTEFYVLRPKGTILPYWIYSIISSDNFLKKGKYSLVGTTGRRRLMKQFVENFQIPLPPLEEQKRIAALFQAIDSAIEQTEEQEGNLLNTKRQLLRELFSDKGKFGNYLTPDDYQKCSFGDFAEQISKRVEPSKTDLEIYVGLEHLDPDNLRIERQGTPADVKGTKLLIYKGDIIFGKRRAYQRKVAVSHFDGICSAHSLVLRAKEKAIRKNFLPFFMQSDAFMDRAVQISEGSLSPTIKWKILEKQEFTIPKMEFQNKLIDLFKQFDHVIYQLQNQKVTLKKLKHSLLDEILD